MTPLVPGKLYVIDNEDYIQNLVLSGKFKSEIFGGLNFDLSDPIPKQKRKTIKLYQLTGPPYGNVFDEILMYLGKCEVPLVAMVPCQTNKKIEYRQLKFPFHKFLWKRDLLYILPIVFSEIEFTEVTT